METEGEERVKLKRKWRGKRERHFGKWQSGENALRNKESKKIRKVKKESVSLNFLRRKM